MGGFAWVTLATNDSYSLGALVLANSLRRVGTPHDLVVLITPGVTDVMREKLSAVFSLVQEVNILDSKDEANLRLLARPELGITFTKLHCWRLTQYEKCVFVDADALVIRNCDELFEREELSAAPDVGWPDCFNSGVFVFKPSQETYDSLVVFATEKGSFDGGDQGLLNMYFSDWAQKDISKHLPFIYNMCSTATYSYLPAFKQFGDDVRIIHFIGATKPWLQSLDTLTGIVQPPPGLSHLQPLLQVWWNIFCDNVHPQLNPLMAGLAGALAKLKLGEPRSNEQTAFEEHMRKQSWEQGQIDYLGRDSFENIWKKISQTLAKATVRESSPSQVQLKNDIKEESLKGEIDEVDKLNTTKQEELTPGVEKGGSTEQQVSSITTESVEAVLPGKVEPVAGKQKVAAETETLLVEEVSKVKEKSFVLGQTEASATTLEEVPKVSELIPETPLITELVPELPVVSEEPFPMPVLFDTPAIPEQVQETPIPESPKVLELIQQTPVVSEVAVAALAPEQDLGVQEKPGPIQEAESILQSEPKESVSQVTLPVGEEAVSSIVSIVQESALAVSETLMDPETSKIEDPKFENGSVNPQTEIIPLSTMPSPPATYKSSTALLTRSPNAVAVIQQSAQVITASEMQSKYETNNSMEAKEVKAPEFRKESKEANETEATKESNDSKPIEDLKKVEQNEESRETQISEGVNGNQEMGEPITQKRKSSVSISMEKPLVAVSEAKLTVRIPQQKPSEQIGSVETSKTEQDQSKSLAPESLSAKTTDEYPERPSRSKESKVPPTPTVIEATPPTSPLNEFKEETGGEPKAVKKLVKKVVKKQSTDDSEEVTEGESSGKKITKKVIKKAVKKTEGPEADNGSTSTEKTKKVVKKTSVKPSHLETDEYVPETPPPECSEVPIPPKRKMKTSTTSQETTSKKSNTEL